MSGAHASRARAGERVVGPVDRLAPEAKLVGLVGFLLVTAVTPAAQPAVLAGQGAVALLVAVVAAVEVRAVLRRLVLDVPLLVLAVTYALAGHGPRRPFLGFAVSEPGLQVGLAMLAKATIAIVAVSAVAATTPISEVVIGMRRLGLPGWFCDLVGLSARQTAVIGDDLQRLRLAAAVRCGGGRRAQWSGVARALGASFVRATERVDRLQVAAQARGGTTLGTVVLPGPPAAPASASSWVLAALPAAWALTIRLVL